MQEVLTLINVLLASSICSQLHRHLHRILLELGNISKQPVNTSNGSGYKHLLVYWTYNL